MSQWKEYKIIESYSWDTWKSFPDPRNGDSLIAPFGYGVYQLRNRKSFEYVLFGKGNHLAYRITSLLPKPLGCGTRNNANKREYVFENLEDIEYRCVSFLSEKEMKDCEDTMKKLKVHLFNT